MKLDKNNNCICDVCKSGDWCMEYLKYRKKKQKEFTNDFKHFENLMDSFTNRCASCKFLKLGKCSKLNIKRTSNDEKCEHWRYFG